jgi:hypothetical protein
MTARARIRLLLAALAAIAGLGFAAPTPASAVCGGGAPGEPCYCPAGIRIGKFTIGEPVQC